jgi:transmembrane 9 superfamily protein 2/4
MNSIETQIPFSYYYLNISMPKNMTLEDEGLSEIFTGDYMYFTNYQIKVNNDQYCKYHDTKNFTNYDTYLFKWMIDRDYRISFYLDKLPAGFKLSIDHDVHYYSGIPIGTKRYENDNTFKYILYNHYTFYVYVNRANNRFSIVAFYIQPLSINHKDKNQLVCAKNPDDYKKNFFDHEKVLLYELDNNNDFISVPFTYDVLFTESTIPFSSRWDHYKHLENDKIHWFSLVNSGLIILIFSLVVLYIFTRSLKRDIEVYNTVHIFLKIACYK